MSLYTESLAENGWVVAQMFVKTVKTDGQKMAPGLLLTLLRLCVCFAAKNT